tara:strand:- start:598 stop:873 length:276 start_codon:yes stop_codon:yes gene_type:complete
MEFPGNPVEFVMNILMNDFNKTGSIKNTIEMFPTPLIVDSLQTAANNKSGVKKGSELLLDNVIAAIERHLKIPDCVIRAEKLSINLMEEYE